MFPWQPVETCRFHTCDTDYYLYLLLFIVHLRLLRASPRLLCSAKTAADNDVLCIYNQTLETLQSIHHFDHTLDLLTYRMKLHSFHYSRCLLESAVAQKVTTPPLFLSWKPCDNTVQRSYPSSTPTQATSLREQNCLLLSLYMYSQMIGYVNSSCEKEKLQSGLPGITLGWWSIGSFSSGLRFLLTVTHPACFPCCSGQSAGWANSGFATIARPDRRA